MKKIYKIADKFIEINSIYEEVHILCKEYLVNDIQPNFKVIISQCDIDFEREKSKKENEYEGIPIKEYSNSYLETLAVYRKICNRLIDDNIVLFHGSCIAVDNGGYLFTAKSGTGKSTHTRLWREFFKNKATMVNDDKPLIKISNNDIIVYGTPWNGKHHLGNNISVPLKAICILERDNTNHIEIINSKNAYPILLQQIYRPKEPSKMIKTLNLLDKLSNNVSLYKLDCNISQEAVLTAYNGMKGF